MTRDFELQERGRAARVETPDGPALVRIVADDETRIVDFIVDPESGGRAVFSSRVVELPGGRSAYVFVVARGPGQSEDEFRGSVASLERELEGLGSAIRPANPEGDHG